MHDESGRRRGDGVLYLRAMLAATAAESHGDSSTTAKEREEFGAFCAVAEKALGLVPSLEALRVGDKPNTVAAQLGFADSRALDEFLMTRGCPPYRALHAWLLLLCLVQEFADGSSLCQWALHSGEWVSSYYRVVKSITRRPWRDVKGLGVRWVVTRAMIAWRAYLDDDGMRPTRV